MGKIIYNGELKTRSDVKVDIEDRGYQFGDGIYEVIRVYNGEVFASNMHVNRLMDSAKMIQLKVPFTVAEIEARVKELIAEDKLRNGIVYMQLTRECARALTLFQLMRWSRSLSPIRKKCPIQEK